MAYKNTKTQQIISNNDFNALPAKEKAQYRRTTNQGAADRGQDDMDSLRQDQKKSSIATDVVKKALKDERMPGDHSPEERKTSGQTPIGSAHETLSEQNQRERG